MLAFKYMRGKFHTHQGFSLIELVVAIGILALGLLSLFGLFSSSLSARSKSANLTSATHLASTELERTVQSAVNDIPGGSQATFWDNEYPAPATPFRQVTTKVAGTEFTTEVFATTVLTPPSGTNRLKQIEIIVTWWGGERAGQGKLRATASRLVTEP